MHSLPPADRFAGAGVYAIYCTGKHPAYKRLVGLDKGKGGSKYPVYIGSAVRENARQGFNPRPTTQTGPQRQCMTICEGRPAAVLRRG